PGVSRVFEYVLECASPESSFATVYSKFIAGNCTLLSETTKLFKYFRVREYSFTQVTRLVNSVWGVIGSTGDVLDCLNRQDNARFEAGHTFGVNFCDGHF